MGSLYDIASDAVVRPREIGHTHLEGRLYEKPLQAIALLLRFLVYVFLVTLIQGEFLVRITRRLQDDLQTNIRVGGLRENTHSLTMSPLTNLEDVCGIIQGILRSMDRVLQDKWGLFRRQAFALALARSRNAPR